jgi:hypothetical protein
MITVRLRARLFRNIRKPQPRSTKEVSMDGHRQTLRLSTSPEFIA